jgi:hypothetical protein
MSRFRLISLGLLAVLTVVAVGASGSASAVEPLTSCGTPVTKTPVYCIEGVQLASGSSEKVAGTNGASVLKTEIGMTEAEVKCGKGKTSGTIEGSATVGKATATIKFEECKLLKPAHCKLTAADEEEIETNELKGELVLTGTGKRIEDKLEPKEGAFASISIEGETGACSISGMGVSKTFNVTGSQLCEIDSSNALAETEETKHALICKPSGGSGTLKLGGNKAEITSEASIKLTSGKKWSVRET